MVEISLKNYEGFECTIQLFIFKTIISNIGTIVHTYLKRDLNGVLEVPSWNLLTTHMVRCVWQNIASGKSVVLTEPCMTRHCHHYEPSTVLLLFVPKNTIKNLGDGTYP